MAVTASGACPVRASDEPCKDAGLRDFAFLARVCVMRGDVDRVWMNLSTCMFNNITGQVKFDLPPGILGIQVQ